VLLQENYKDQNVHFTLSLAETGLLHVSFTGKGSNPGTRRFISLVEEGIAIEGTGSLQVLMDMRELTSVPLRSQVMMGKWLMAIKGRLGKVAVVGGGSVARGLARTAGMKQVRFFQGIAEAEEWLG
jgi:hypothetical protein